MNKLTREEKIDLINQLIKHKREIDIFHKKFDELFGVSPGFVGNGESTYKVFDNLFNDFISMVADLIGETKYGIEWFVWENDCGRNGMEAGLDGKEIKIETAEDYLNLVGMVKNEH